MAIKIRGEVTGSIKNARKTSKGGKSPIDFIGKDGKTVMFLTEPDEWFGYREHYRNGYFACSEGDCPGCEAGDDVSFRYLVNAVDMETDQAIALKIPKTVANRLILKYDKYETIMDRPYEIMRMGDGSKNGTEYDVTPEAPVRKFRPEKYKKFDLEKLVVNAWNEFFGNDTDDDDDGDDEDEAPRRTRTRSTSRAAGRTTTTRKVAKKTGSARTAKKAVRRTRR